jgi:hypothetical protein
VGGECVTHRGKEKEIYKHLMGEPEGKRPLERPRHRWEYGIGTDLMGVEWIQLVEDRNWWRAVVNTVMNLCVLEPQS